MLCSFPPDDTDNDMIPDAYELILFPNDPGLNTLSKDGDFDNDLENLRYHPHLHPYSCGRKCPSLCR